MEEQSLELELRDEFWNEVARPEWERLGPTAEQNDYPVAIRLAWTDFMEEKQDIGDISEEVMDNTTL